MPFGWIERQRLDEPRDHVVGIPGVDEQRAGQNVCCPGKLAQQQDAAPAAGQVGLGGLAEHELLGDEVHPVAERRHHHHVGAPVEQRELGGRDAAVEVLDRRAAGLPEAPVHVGDPPFDLIALRPVLAAL